MNDELNRARPVDDENLPKERTSAPVVLKSSPICLPSPSSANVNPVHVRKTFSTVSQQIHVSSPSSPSPAMTVSKSDSQRSTVARTTERSVAQLPVVSRPSNTTSVPGSRSITPVVSTVQTAPLLARSVSVSGRLGPDPSLATHSYAPQSYRNAMMGNTVTSTATSFTLSNSSSSGVSLLPSYSQPSPMVSSPMVYLSQTSERMDSNASSSGPPFDMIARDVLQNGSPWVENSQREVNMSMHYDEPSGYNDVQKLDMFRPSHSRSMSSMPTEFPACTSGRQAQGLLAEEFPHLDIINDLLDDEPSFENASSVSQSLNNGPRTLSRQFTSGDLGTCDDDLRSSASSCRFERSQSYDYGFHQGYSSSSMHFDSIRDYVPQGSTLPYVNRHVDGFIENQWQVANSDLSSYLSLRHTENDGYPYYPDYSSMACGANGYSVFRPSNGR